MYQYQYTHKSRIETDSKPDPTLWKIVVGVVLALFIIVIGSGILYFYKTRNSSAKMTTNDTPPAYDDLKMIELDTRLQHLPTYSETFPKV